MCTFAFAHLPVLIIWVLTLHLFFSDFLQWSTNAIVKFSSILLLLWDFSTHTYEQGHTLEPILYPNTAKYTFWRCAFSDALLKKPYVYFLTGTYRYVLFSKCLYHINPIQVTQSGILRLNKRHAARFSFSVDKIYDRFLHFTHRTQSM